MSSTATVKPATPFLLRLLMWCWLGFQCLLLVFILATHGAGMEPDLRMLSGAGSAFGSFPLSILTMYIALLGIEHYSSQTVLLNSVITWASGFFAGVVQLWLLNKLVSRLSGSSKARPADS